MTIVHAKIDEDGTFQTVDVVSGNVPKSCTACEARIAGSMFAFLDGLPVCGTCSGHLEMLEASYTGNAPGGLRLDDSGETVVIRTAGGTEFGVVDSIEPWMPTHRRCLFHLPDGSLWKSQVRIQDGRVFNVSRTETSGHAIRASRHVPDGMMAALGQA